MPSRRTEPAAGTPVAKLSVDKLPADKAAGSATLTHIDGGGAARMVDVSLKPATERVAVAAGFVRMSAATLELVLSGNAKKGDVLGVARIAGIMAAKKTHELIPLCHPLLITRAEVEITPEPDGLAVQATVKVTGQTGVEMEALTAVSVACLTIYDMVKAVERGMTIEAVHLVEKRGGKSGNYKSGDDTSGHGESGHGESGHDLAPVSPPLSSSPPPADAADGKRKG
jgi:cyclic pyranopterin monophosphate synthase